MSTRNRHRITRDQRLGVSYARYSDEKQDSINEQHSDNDAQARVAGIEIVEKFQDVAVSRRVDNRDGIAAMWKYLEGRPDVGFIAVTEVARLMEGTAQPTDIKKNCQRLNITLLVKRIGEVPPHHQRKWHELEKQSVHATGEVLQVGERTRDRIQRRVEDNERFVQMRPPFGIRSKPVLGPDGTPLPSGTVRVNEKGKRIRSTEIEVDPDEIEWLRVIFDLSDAGKSDYEIARYLTGRTLTKTKNTVWRANTVAGILTNPIYKGVIIWGVHETYRKEGSKKVSYVIRDTDSPERVTKPSPLGALVPVDQWERINARRTAQVGELRQKRRSVPTQIFDEYVYCYYCGYRMYGRFENAGRPDPARPYKHRNGRPFRYYCDSKQKRTGQPVKFGAAAEEPCTIARSMTDVQIINALRMAPGSAPARFRPQLRDLPTLQQETQRLNAAVSTSALELQRATELHIKRPKLMPETRLFEMEAVHDQLVETTKAELRKLQEQAAPLTFEKETQWRAMLAELADTLADPLLPVELKRLGLRKCGIERIYLDRPFIEIELLHGDAST